MYDHPGTAARDSGESTGRPNPPRANDSDREIGASGGDRTINQCWLNKLSAVGESGVSISGLSGQLHLHA
jgi:hypothetical protein